MAKSVGRSGGDRTAKPAAAGKSSNATKKAASSVSSRVIRESSLKHRDALKRLADK